METPLLDGGARFFSSLISPPFTLNMHPALKRVNTGQLLGRNAAITLMRRLTLSLLNRILVKRVRINNARSMIAPFHGFIHTRIKYTRGRSIFIFAVELLLEKSTRKSNKTAMVVMIARERAREYLRDGEANATEISRKSGGGRRRRREEPVGKKFLQFNGILWLVLDASRHWLDTYATHVPRKAFIRIRISALGRRF